MEPTGQAASLLHLVATYVTAAVVVLCPLPFGSVDPFWVLAWCIPLALSLPFFDFRKLKPGHLAILAPVTAVVLLVLVVVWLQTGPARDGLPVHPAWRAAEAALGRPLPRMASIDPARSWSALAAPILMFLAFACSFIASAERASAVILFRAAAYAGGLYALYAIFAQVIDPNSLLGKEKIAYVGDLTGTFVNRNTAATFFGAVLILWGVRLMAELDKRVPRSATGVRDFGAVLLDRPSRELVLALLGTTLAFGALLMTRSRAGVLLSLGSLFLACLLFLRHRISGRLASFGVIAAILLMLGLVLELLGGAVAGRISSQGLVDASRLSAYTVALEMVRSFPLLGTGLGTFEYAFPPYRSIDVSTVGVWDRAHNTPIEIAVELGLPAAIAVVALWLGGLAQLLGGGLTRRRDANFAITAFGLGLLGSLHALVDFSPQIPGFGVFWIALLGCGLAQSLRTEAGRSRTGHPTAGETVRTASPA